MDSVNSGFDDVEISEEKQPLQGDQIALDYVNGGSDNVEISEENQPLQAAANTGCDDTHEISSDEWMTIFILWDKNEYFATAELSDIFTLSSRKVREVFLRGQPLHQVHSISSTQHVIVSKLEGSGDTSLHLCAKAGHVKAMEILIKVANSSANLNVQNNNGDTPLHLALREGHRKLVRKLLAAGSDVNSQNHSGENALMLASQNGEDAIVKKLLERPKIDVNLSTTRTVQGSTQGKTALHFCAQHGHVNIVNMLIKAVAPLNPTSPLLATNAKDANGNTALHLAAQGGHPEVVEELLTPLYKCKPKEVTATGADVDQSNSEDEIAPHVDGQEGHSEGGRKLLRSVSFLKDSDPKIRSINVVADGAKVNIQNNNGETALMMALTIGQEDIIRKLLNAQGVDVNLKNNGSKTALHIAAEKCEAKILDILLEVQGFDVQVQDIYDQTPLHIAVQLGKDAVVTKLISHRGFNLLKDKDGQTPLQIALDLQYDTIVRSMKDHIAMLYRNRQVYVDAANAILVGAALIASVTFASWLQPPLGYTTFYGEQYSNPDSATPTSNPMYAAFDHHQMLEFFWVFNSLSFFSAIASVIMGARSVLPSHAQELTINQEVKRLRDGLLATGCMLTVSMAFVLAAFAMAGLVLLPPLPGLHASSTAIMAIGGGLCLWFLLLLSRKIWIELSTP